MRTPGLAECALAACMAVLSGCDKRHTPTRAEAPPAELARAASAEPTPPREPTPPHADTLAFAAGLPPMPTPEGNPTTPAKVALGQRLFFEKRLSADASRSCYSCHQNEDGTGGHEALAIGALNKPLTRHSPVLWNVGYLTKLYWDGRSDSLEAQATAAWAGGNMGVGKENLSAKASEIAKLPGYKKLFDKAFPGRGVTPETIVQALSAYERTLVCDNTAYDRYAKGDKAALTERQKEGLVLFTGKAGCAACHAPPFFSVAFGLSQAAFFNVGIGTDGKKEQEVDPGRMAVTKEESDWAAFKPPSLRNVAKSAPYFHDGSVATLEQAVRTMATGGIRNKNLTTLLVDRKLTDSEFGVLLDFLRALDCEQHLEEPKAL